MLLRIRPLSRLLRELCHCVYRDGCNNHCCDLSERIEPALNVILNKLTIKVDVPTLQTYHDYFGYGVCRIAINIVLHIVIPIGKCPRDMVGQWFIVTCIGLYVHHNWH